MSRLVALEPVSLASTGIATIGPGQDSAQAHPYPSSALKPVRSEGTFAFLSLVAGLGVLLLLGWLVRRRRATSRPGLPDESLFPPAMPHQQIHDRKYLSRILSSDEPPRS